MSLWLAEEPLLLASRSSIRRSLLTAAGVPVEVRPADVDERALELEATSPTPGAVAALLARRKALAVAALAPGRLTLGADQVLALGPRRFSKPADRAAARAQLRALSGCGHDLHSAIAFVQGSQVLFEHVAVARLTMRVLTEAFLDRYLDETGAAVLGSVGAYQLEGPGIQLFERIEGDYFTVLGLPLIEVLDFLRRHGCLPQ